MMLLPIVLAVHVRTLDLRFDAVPVAMVVAAIAKSSGQSLTVNSDVGKEIVALRLPGVTPEQAMDILAEGLDATWTTEAGSKRLLRTSDQLTQERIADERLREEAYRRGVAKLGSENEFDPERYFGATKLIERLNSDLDLSSTEVKSIRAAIEVLEGDTPAHRLANRILREISVPAAIQLAQSKAVFHSRPNARQQPASPQLRQAFSRFHNESAMVNELGGSTWDLSSKELAQVTDFEVILDGIDGSVRLQYRLLDRLRNPIGGGLGFITPDYGFASSARSRPDDSPLDPFSRTGLPESMESRYSFALFDQLLDIERRDPLSYVGSSLVDWATKRNEGLVAVLSDSLLSFDDLSGVTPIEQLTGAGLRTTERAGVLWISPFDRRDARRNQTDRTALKEWLDRERQGKGLSLADYQRLSHRLPLVEERLGLYRWLQRCGVQNPYWNTPLLRMVGALPRNVTVRFSALPVAVRQQLNALVLNGSSPSYIFPFGGCGNGSELSGDVTDQWSSGISPEATVKFSEAVQPCFVQSRLPSGVPNYTSCWTLEEIGEGSGFDDDDRVRTAKCHRFTVTIDARTGDPYLGQVEAISDIGSPIEVRQLPKFLLDAVRKARMRQTSG